VVPLYKYKILYRSKEAVKKGNQNKLQGILVKVGYAGAILVCPVCESITEDESATDVTSLVMTTSVRTIAWLVPLDTIPVKGPH
jgi:hypothetical protein